ncbi:hypothetical protein J6590_027363 [Homalodisca vitripennis]|nr:hypothetical protein J6590_027363 [Homalodisca vitripennis]
MSSFTTALLVAITCYTSGHPQDEAHEPMVYIKIPHKVPETIENTVSRSNAFHPLVRFRTIEVQPVYFFVVGKSSESAQTSHQYSRVELAIDIKSRLRPAVRLPIFTVSLLNAAVSCSFF